MIPWLPFRFKRIDDKDVLGNAKISIFWQNESKIRNFQQNEKKERKKKWRQISNKKISVGRFWQGRSGKQSSKLDFRIYWPENFKIRIFISILLKKFGKNHWSESIFTGLGPPDHC
jgi:hypothetical protein